MKTKIIFSNNSYNEVWDATTTVAALLVCYGYREFTLESMESCNFGNCHVRDRYLGIEENFQHEYYHSFFIEVYRKARALWTSERKKFETEYDSKTHSLSWKWSPHDVYIKEMNKDINYKNYLTNLDMLFCKMADILYMIKLSDYIKRNNDDRKIELLINENSDTMSSKLTLNAESYRDKNKMVTRFSSSTRFVGYVTNSIIDKTFHDDIIDFSWTNKELADSLDQFKNTIKPATFAIECKPEFHPIEAIDGEREICLES